LRTNKIWHLCGCQILFVLNYSALAQEGWNVDYVTHRCIAIPAREIKPLLIKATNRTLGTLISRRTLRGLGLWLGYRHSPM
jgi:hypothetical protein